MKVQNNNKLIITLLIVIIILAILCVLLATNMIEFKPNEVTNNNETTDYNQNNNYATWMNYILKQNIIDVNIDRSKYADDPSDEYHAEVNLTTEQLKSVFSKLMDYGLVKYYSQGGGFTYGDILTISYSVNGTNYDVKIANGQLWADNDNLRDADLLDALENSKYTIEDEDIENTEGSIFNYRFQGYNESIFDEYFE